MGGTNIAEPLKDIFNNKEEYLQIKLSKNILILTDGEVDNKNECFNLIKENSNIFRMHSIGIGDDFDKELINLSGKYGKGSSNYVENINNINNTVIKILNNCLLPYLYDIKFYFLNLNNEDKKNIFVNTNNCVYQDEIINYSFILDDDNKKLLNNIYKFKIEYIKSLKKIEKDFEFRNIFNLPEGENMTKIIIDKYLKYDKTIDKNREINLSKEYEVLSKNTSLYAEIINEKSQEKKLIQSNILSKERKNYSSFRNYGSMISCRRSVSCGYAARVNFGGYVAARTCCPVLMEEKGSSNEDSDNENSENSDEKNEEDLEQKLTEDIDLTELIISQDPIEGFWNRNDNTVKLEELLEKNIINNINNICSKYKESEKEKIYYTILIIYIIENKYKEKVDEYILVLNKAKNYLKQKGIIYEGIISKIEAK